MKLTQKKVGLGIVALAAALLGSVAIADNMDRMGMDMGMGGPMMLPPALTFEAVDGNKDGKISQDEVTAWRATQSAGVDANADGKLSVDELAAMQLKDMTTAARDMAQKMVDRLDTDGDKLLSAAELLAPPMPADLFDRVDTNQDGFIDKAEADAARKMMTERGRGDHGGKHQRPPLPGMPGDPMAPASNGGDGN